MDVMTPIGKYIGKYIGKFYYRTDHKTAYMEGEYEGIEDFYMLIDGIKRMGIPTGTQSFIHISPENWMRIKKDPDLFDQLRIMEGSYFENQRGPSALLGADRYHQGDMFGFSVVVDDRLSVFEEKFERDFI